MKGKISVAPTITRVVNSRHFPRKLLKKDLRLRITSTIKLAEIADSTNQPVLNRVIGLFKISPADCRGCFPIVIRGESHSAWIFSFFVQTSPKTSSNCQNGAGEGTRTPASPKAHWLTCSDPFCEFRSRGQRDNHSATPALVNSFCRVAFSFIRQATKCYCPKPQAFRTLEESC